VGFVRLPRLPFWYVMSIAILSLFWGHGPILMGIQHNWVGTLILLGVSFFYNGRFGFTQHVVRESRLSNKTRIVLRVLAVTTFLSGILIEVFLSFLPSIVLIPLIVICAAAAPTCLYFSLLK
jgi:hypothetical protein